MRCSRSRRSVRPAIPYRTTASCLFRPEQRALEAATTRLADWLSSHPEASLADVAFTLQVGRRRFPHRRFVVCRSVEEGVAALRQPLAKPVVSHRRSLRAHHCLHVPRRVRNTSGWHAAYTNGNLSSAIASIAVRLCSRTSSVATSARFLPGVRGHTSRRNESLPKLGRSPASSQLRWRLQSCSRPGASSPPHVGHSVGEFAAARGRRLHSKTG